MVRCTAAAGKKYVRYAAIVVTPLRYAAGPSAAAQRGLGLVTEPSSSCNTALIEHRSQQQFVRVDLADEPVHCTKILLAYFKQPANGAFSAGVDCGTVAAEYSDRCCVLRGDVCHISGLVNSTSVLRCEVGEVFRARLYSLYTVYVATQLELL